MEQYFDLIDKIIFPGVGQPDRLVCHTRLISILGCLFIWLMGFLIQQLKKTQSFSTVFFSNEKKLKYKRSD